MLTITQTSTPTFRHFSGHNSFGTGKHGTAKNNRANASSKSKRGSAPALILSALMQDNRISVLFADDDPDDRDLFEEAVAELHANIELNLFKDGVQLMEFLNKKDCVLPDIIFLDLNMPVKDGKECLREIRENNALMNIPVVIYTTTNSVKDVDETFSLGANLFARKPTSYKNVVQLAKQIFMLNWADYQPKHSKKNYVFTLK